VAPARGRPRPRPMLSAPMSSGFLRRRGAFGGYLAVGLAAIASYYLVPENSVAQTVFYTAIGVYGIVGLVTGACVNLRGAQRRPWLLFAAGLVAFVVGDSIFDAYAI